MNAEIKEKLETLLKGRTYWNKYGFDVWISLIIIMIVLLTITYLNLLNYIQPLRADWENQRCKPNIMPFAGIINPDDNKDAFDYTMNNFEQCSKSTLNKVTNTAFEPMHYHFSMMSMINNINHDMINGVGALVQNVRLAFTAVMKKAFNVIFTAMVPFMRLSENINNLGQKIMAIFTTSLYTLFGSYSLLKTTFLIMDNAFMRVLGITVAIIIGLWLFPWTWGAAAAGCVFMVALLAFIIPTRIFMNDVLNLSSHSNPGVPGKPACFTGDTKIKLKNGTVKDIKDIEVGEILCDSAIITSTFKLSSKGQDMYDYNNIRVSGKHRVFDEEIGWVAIQNHPKSTEITDFREPYLYCLNTNTKVLNINNVIFLDWDDLDEMNLIDIRVMCVGNGLIPKKFEKDDIHKYLDCGLTEETLIELEDGRSVSIKDIEVNDILRFGEWVQGIVKIKGDDIFYMKHFEAENLKGSGNILINDAELGVMNTSYLKGGDNISEKYIYNLLTDTGFYHVNGIRLSDYNSGLDQYLHYAWN